MRLVWKIVKRSVRRWGMGRWNIDWLGVCFCFHRAPGGGRVPISGNTMEALHAALKIIQKSTNAALGLNDITFTEDGH